MRSGFTLIEILIALSISSIIVFALYSTFSTTIQIINRADNMMSFDTKIDIIHNRIEKDVEGIFAPIEFEKPVPPKKKEEEKGDTKKQEEKKPLPDKQEASKEKVENVQKFENIFYSVNKDKNLEKLSFITTNPLKIYEKATNTKSKQNLVRVVYRLSKDENNPNAFKLLRQESQELDLKAFDLNAPKKIRPYMLIDNIKSFTVSYEFPEKKSEEKTEGPKKPNEKKEQKNEPIAFKKVIEWKQEGDTESNQFKIPQFVTMSIELWSDATQNRVNSFTLRFELPSFKASTHKKKSPQPSVPKKEDKKQQEKKEAEQSKKPLSPSKNEGSTKSKLADTLNKIAKSVLAQNNNQPSS